MQKRSDLVIFTLLALLAIAFRTVLHIGPNIELVTASSIAAGYFLKNKRLAMLFPIIVMIITDSIIGNTSIFIFTWSAFLITPLIGIFNAKYLNGSTALPRTLFINTSGAILSVLVFYLWTNFGVIVTTEMYPDTLTGLMQSYINALPFLKNQLYGNIIFSPIIFLLVILVKSYLAEVYEKKYKFSMYS